VLTHSGNFFFCGKGIESNAIKLGVRGFVRICIETYARGYFGAWKYRFKKGHANKTDAVHLSKMTIFSGRA
jgi:hypothetical protein